MGVTGWREAGHFLERLEMRSLAGSLEVREGRMGSSLNHCYSSSEARLPVPAPGSAPPRRTESSAVSRQDRANEGRSLYQGSFFFCTVKPIGDLPTVGTIYVETVVEPHSGAGFAKVYSSQDPLNAVDLLESRVIPFLQGRGEEAKEVFTPRTSEYCGILAKHAFATFLAASHMEHVVMNTRDDPYYHLCEQFYRFLLKEVFQPELRRKFQFSIEELQRDLDEFLRTHNSGK
jgi:hypothetical protein